MEALLTDVGKAATTDEAEHKAYDEAAKAQPPEPEIHARHILLPTEDEAKEALARVKKGEDFAKVATELSKDPAGEGGDLGWFTKDQMVPEFADAAFKMEPGQISDPVKTQFGWHIIKVEEKRMKTFPPFEQVKDQAARYVAQKAQQALILQLHKAARSSGSTPTPSRAARRRRPRRQTAPAAGRQAENALTRAEPTREQAGLPSSSAPETLMAAPAPLSPLAPKKYPALPPIEGVRFATVAAGVRYAGRTDVMLALFDAPAAVAGVFTRSKCPSAPVDWCRAHLKGGKARALVVNSGNANAFTGGVGASAVAHVAEAAAKATGAAPGEIFMASTGVIGEPLDARASRASSTSLSPTRAPTG